MGNSHSSHPSANKNHHYRRKRSTIFPRFSLGCASFDSSRHSLEPSVDTNHFGDYEKSLLRERLSPTRRPETPVASPVSFLAYNPTPRSSHEEGGEAYIDFLRVYPEYRLTWILDTLRRTDFSRLERTGETYVDYMGGSLYPESLIRVHADFLNNSVLGNTHSISNSSRLALECANEARSAVLSFFRAPPEYTVIFTANTTASLKLIGESYPFTGGSNLVLASDSHNSVHGIREFAHYRGARCSYIPSTSSGGFELATAKNIILRNRPRSKDLTPSLFILTAQSNISNSKNPLSIIEYASSLGFHTVIDAAALVPTTAFSLSEYPVDAMAVSFYKMFGFPTGVGALIVKKTFLAELKRPWFAGGTVDVVQVPGNIVTRASEIHEQFEDGTINYLTLPAIADGLRFLSAYLPFLPLRLSCLLHYLITSLLRLRHENSDQPVVRLLSRIPAQRLRSVGEQADTGFMVSLLFLDPSGAMIPNSFIEYSASQQNISLRTGCVCNPGGAAAILGITEQMSQLYPGVTLHDFEKRMGRELGVVRISLGLASNFQDVQRVVQFAALMGNGATRNTMWNEWTGASGPSIGQAI